MLVSKPRIFKPQLVHCARRCFASAQTATATPPTHYSKAPQQPAWEGSFSQNMLKLVWDEAQKNVHKAAFIDAVDRAKQRTFNDVFLNSYSLATFLRNELNFERGDVATTFFGTHVDFASICLGSTLSGGVLSPASNHFTPDELVRQLNDNQASVVFCLRSNVETVLEIKSRCPNLKEIIVLDHNSPVDGTISFDEIRTLAPSFSGVSDVRSEDDLFLPYSSGTTGLPKGVELTNRNFSTLIANFVHFLSTECYPKLSEWQPEYVRDHEPTLMLLPCFHIFGAGLLLSSLAERRTSVILSQYDTKVLCQALQDFKIRWLTLAPPVLLALAKHPIIDQFDLSALQVLLSGAAPSGKDLIAAVQNRIPSVKSICQGYGLTETSMMVTCHSLIHPGPENAVGMLSPGYELRVIDTETGEPLGTNESGELWVRSEQVMKGYYKRESDTQATFGPDGWLKTGDIGYIDDAGYVFVVDRLKELIKVKGFQVPPAELEDILISHPDIHDAAVIGVPCEQNGEKPVGFVVRAGDHLEDHHVHDYVNERVSHYKQLKGGVVFVDQIPKNAAGKILRRVLRDTHSSK